MQKKDSQEEIPKEIGRRDPILYIRQEGIERAEDIMLEEILIECVADMIADPKMNYRFDSPIASDSIRILFHRKEKLGKEYFYLTKAEVNGNEHVFYVGSYRICKMIESKRSNRIDGILDGRDNKRY